MYIYDWSKLQNQSLVSHFHVNNVGVIKIQISCSVYSKSELEAIDVQEGDFLESDSVCVHDTLWIP